MLRKDIKIMPEVETTHPYWFVQTREFPYSKPEITSVPTEVEARKMVDDLLKKRERPYQVSLFNALAVLIDTRDDGLPKLREQRAVERPFKYD